MDLQDILDEARARHGDRVAIQHKASRLSWAELPDALDSVERRLGYLRGARVAVLLTDSLSCCLLYLHLFRSGATAIPISVHASGPQLAQIIGRAQPHFVVTNKILHKKHAEFFGDFDCVLVDPSAEEDLEFRFEERRRPSAGASGGGRAEGRAPEDTRVVLFTSGSTGTPKGVCLSESNVLAAAGMMAEFLSLGPERRTLVTLPMYDYYGYIQVFGHALRGGGCIIGESVAFVGSLLKIIDAEEATDLAIVPYSLRKILDAVEKKSSTALRKLRFVTSSSDMLSRDVLERTFRNGPDLVAYNIYGLTEAGRACYREITAATPFSSSIGRPSAGVQIHVEGSPEEPGEIVIEGPNVAKGYLREISDDRIQLIPCERVASGDLGYRNEEGEIVLVGRKDHIINVMGEKIHPAEIESLAIQVAGVDDALASPVTDDTGTVSIALDVVCADLDASRAELEKLLRSHLSRAFVPTAIRAVSEIARTELGAKAKRSGAA